MPQTLPPTASPAAAPAAATAATASRRLDAAGLALGVVRQPICVEADASCEVGADGFPGGLATVLHYEGQRQHAGGAREQLGLHSACCRVVTGKDET